MKLEDYIKALPADLQEKARACGSVSELLALARQNKVALPDEVLAAVAGGDDPDPENCGQKVPCPKCGSTDTAYDPNNWGYICYNCGYKWEI